MEPKCEWVSPHSWESEIFQIIVPGELQNGLPPVPDLKWHVYKCICGFFSILISHYHTYKHKGCRTNGECQMENLTRFNPRWSCQQIFLYWCFSATIKKSFTPLKAGWHARICSRRHAVHLNSATCSTLIHALSIRSNHPGHFIQTPSVKFYHQNTFIHYLMESDFNGTPNLEHTMAQVGHQQTGKHRKPWIFKTKGIFVFTFSLLSNIGKFWKILRLFEAYRVKHQWPLNFLWYSPIHQGKTLSKNH